MDFLFFLFIFGFVPLFFIWFISRILKRQHRNNLNRERFESENFRVFLGRFSKKYLCVSVCVRVREQYSVHEGSLLFKA